MTVTEDPEARAIYTRTVGDLLVGGGLTPEDYDGVGINPGDSPPVFWWFGTDTGGGAWPIGPNGPWPGAGTGQARPVVTRATSLVTGPLSAAPFRVLDASSLGVELPRPRWVTDPQLLRPDSRFPGSILPAAMRLPRSEFWASWVRSAMWWGEGAFLCQEDETGQPLAGSLRHLDSHLLTTARPDGTTLVWGLEWPDGGEPVLFDRDGYLDLGPVRYRMVVLRNPHSPIDSEGRSLGVFAMHPDAFQLAGQIDTYASGTFRSGIPAGYLQTETPGFSQAQADDLKAKWLAAHGGDRRSIAVLNATTRFVPLNLSPVDAALDSVKRLSIADVAFAFGLDPEVLGVTLSNSGTYRNAQEFWGRHRDFSLAPWVSAVSDVLSALMSGTQTVVVDLDGFANPAPSERFAAYDVAIRAGILTVDEVRAREGLPPAPATSTETRSLSVAETIQKVYLGVVNGVITRDEARAIINDAGGTLALTEGSMP